MVVELELLEEGLPARAAEEVLDSGMDSPQVAIQMPLLKEGRLAIGARKSPDLVVVDPVVLELGRRQEDLVAVRTRVAPELDRSGLVRMFPDPVLLQVDQLLESATAILTPKRIFLRMSQKMPGAKKTSSSIKLQIA